MQKSLAQSSAPLGASSSSIKHLCVVSSLPINRLLELLKASHLSFKIQKLAAHYSATDVYLGKQS